MGLARAVFVARSRSLDGAAWGYPPPRMFSIVISEKGGAERRETYDRTEINVGRVQGNDLMLPKGNVSKRHARLLFRDGRFIVTDLKSTNGTYVNGRKISQATIVREGDKIYIGDFVLRIEASGPGMASPSEPPRTPEDNSSQVASPAPAVQRPPNVAPLDPPSSSSESNQVLGRTGNPPKAGQDIVSHFPLEHDPDDSMQYQVPAPPLVPSGPRGLGLSKSQPVPNASSTGPTPIATRIPAVSPPIGAPASPGTGSVPPPSPQDEP